MAGTFSGGVTNDGSGKVSIGGDPTTELATQESLDDRFSRLQSKFNKLVFWLAASGFQLPDELLTDMEEV